MVTRRRVVHVFGAMDLGGAELRTVQAVESLGRSEFDTAYVTLSGHAGLLGGRIRESGDRVVPIRLDLRFPFRFIRFLRANRADVVHSHVATFSGATLALARLAGVRRRIAHFRSDGDQQAGTPARRAQRLIMKFLLSNSATDIIGVSPGSLDHGWRARWRADPRCRVIANGLDVRRLPAVDDRQRMRDELGIAHGTRVVCHVGRPDVVKNRQRAIDLACHPAVAGAGVVLLVVGALADGEAGHWLARADAHGREHGVRLLGSRNDVLRILNVADLTLVTSVQEGLPGVVLESLAVGTPVLSSDLPGSRWIAESLPGIRIQDLADPDEAWARAVVSCATAECARARLRAAFAEGPFLLENNAAELSALWREKDDPTCG